MKTKILVAAFASLASVPFTTQAAFENSPVFATITRGISNYKGVDAASVTEGFLIGFSPVRMLDIQLGYMDLGEVNLTHDLFGAPTTQVNTAYLAVKPTLRSGIIDLYARAGYSHWKLDASYNGETESDSGNDRMYGAGVDFYIVDQVAVGLSYTKHEIDDSYVGSYEANVTIIF